MHASTDNSEAQEFEFNVSIDGGSNYNVAKTTTTFRSGHNETDTTTQLSYVGSYDLAQGTGYQLIAQYVGNGNDESCSGTLHLFDPSNTTFVKHYTSRFIANGSSNFSADYWVSGFINTTSAITTVKFLMAGGDFDSGQISLYGVKG